MNLNFGTPYRIGGNIDNNNNMNNNNNNKGEILNGERNIVLAELSPIVFDGNFNFGNDMSIIGLIFVIVVWVLWCCLWLCIPEKDDIPLIAKHAAIPSYVKKIKTNNGGDLFEGVVTRTGFLDSARV